MSVLVVGLSHKSAPVPVLERSAVGGDTLSKLLSDLFRAQNVAGTFVISTCNRVEVYADVDRFHGGVSAICELLSRHCGIPVPELTAHLYVHYEEQAVKHLLAVACGLDSMVVGEGQILGQVRRALKLATEAGTLGRTLGDLGAVALRTGKRAHTETGIDRVGASLVSVGIEVAASGLGADGREPVTRGELLRGKNVLIVGAGSMSALAAATAARAGASRVAVANRTRHRAEKVAASVGGQVADFADVRAAIAGADLVISCTGAPGLIITEEDVSAALALRPGSGGDSGTAGAARPLAVLDLAMPRDVDTRTAALPGVTLIGMEQLAGAGQAAPAGGGYTGAVAAARGIVDEEFAGYLSAENAARVTPTVVALRAKAAEVVDAELARLSGRLNGAELNARALDEISQTVRRVVDKLLHAPTVRVKELAGSPGGDSYDMALRVLFDLDPRTVEAVTSADTESAAAGEAGADPERHRDGPR